MSEEEKVTCVRCYQVAGDKDQYCVKCGAPLVNRCSDLKTAKGKHGCGHVNRPEALYCAKCGTETIFKQQGLL
ncbi:MAG TPA: hypothetical protein GX497_16445 [Bacillus bacterium]|nr:hypothetical protein [Bacillus sp. (in: firmicutes)]